SCRHITAVGDLDALDSLFVVSVGPVLVPIVEDVPGGEGLALCSLLCVFDGTFVETGLARGAVAGAREAGAQVAGAGEARSEVAGAEVARADQARGCIGGTNSRG